MATGVARRQSCWCALGTVSWFSGSEASVGAESRVERTVGDLHGVRDAGEVIVLDDDAAGRRLDADRASRRGAGGGLEGGAGHAGPGGADHVHPPHVVPDLREPAVV